MRRNQATQTGMWEWGTCDFCGEPAKYVFTAVSGMGFMNPLRIRLHQACETHKQKWVNNELDV